MATLSIQRHTRRTFSLKEWADAKRTEKSTTNIWQLQNFFLSLQLFKNSCNQLRGATVFAQPFGRAFLLPKASLYDGCLLVNFHALRSIALFLNNGESSRHPYQDGCKFKNSAIMATLSIQRRTRRTFSLKEWADAKRTEKSTTNIWQLQNFFLSLLRQNHRFNICNERELVKYPSSFAFQPHKILTAAFHAGFSAYTDLTVVLTNLEAQPSLRLYPAVPGNVKTTVIMATLSIQRRTRRTFSLKEWADAKRTEKSTTNIWQLQNFFLSLPCQKINCGTSAADQCRQFLYPHFSENNITAPCRVCGNAPGSPAIEALTTRSAVSYCQKSIVMATLSIQRHTRRAFSLKEWMKAKGTSINAWLHGRSEFYSRICDFSVTRLLVIRIHLVFLCIIGTVLTVEHHPLLSVVFGLCAVYLVWRINGSTIAKNQQSITFKEQKEDKL